jgi:hypothetical protein
MSKNSVEGEGIIEIMKRDNSLIWDYYETTETLFKFGYYEQLFKMAYEKQGSQSDNYYCAFINCSIDDIMYYYIIKIISPKLLDNDDVKNHKLNKIFSNDTYQIYQAFNIELISHT